MTLKGSSRVISNFNVDWIYTLMNFRDYFEQQEMMSGRRPWKARRKDVITFWQGLQPNLPLQPNPVSKQHKGTKFREDGIRITGSSIFINSILSHIKDFLRFESDPQTKLEVEYRQIEGKSGQPMDGTAYACYVYVLRDEETVRKMLGAVKSPII